LKTFVLLIIVVLLLGGIIGTSVNVFHSGKASGFVSIADHERFSFGDKLSMRQIDSLSAASNLSFTIKNALR
jgi:hypothetical protein